MHQPLRGHLPVDTFTLAIGVIAGEGAMRYRYVIGAGVSMVAAVVLSACTATPPPVGLVVPTMSVGDYDTPSTSRTIDPSTSSEPPAPMPAPAVSSSSRPASPPRTSAAPPPPSTPQVTFVANAQGRIGYYSARDNSPPNSRSIAFPNARHRQAGGTGTFDDPITLAAGNGQMVVGTRVYVPDVRRYFVAEDLCSFCSNGDIVLWTGESTDSGITACERSLLRNGLRPYEVNPPPGLPVVPGDLFQNGRCFTP